MEDDFWLPSCLMRMKEHLQAAQDVKDLVLSIRCLLCTTTTTTTTTTTGGDSDESSSRTDIVGRVKDFLKMIPRDSKKKSFDHLDIFALYYAPKALVSLLDSPIKSHKKIGEESIQLFLYPEIGSLPRTIQNQFASIVLRFCELLRGSANDEHLYYSCRETLGSLLNSIGGFAKTLKTFDYTIASDLIQILYPFVNELSDKLSQGLKLISQSALAPVSSCFRLSFERDIHEFALFSLQLRRAIEVHVRSKGQLLPLCFDVNNFDEHHPCYLREIDMFHMMYRHLLLDINLCMINMGKCIKEAEVVWEFNHGWSYYLSVLKELNAISKLYQGAEEDLSSDMLVYQFSLDVLVMYSKWSDDHQWLLKHKNVGFESRRHLMRLMFPEVKDDHEKLNKMFIDRSYLLTQSFEHIAHANPRSLRKGLFMEFKNEVATGHGVLREWIFLVCQALFSPDNSLFLACPSDQRRFFPNPAMVDPQHLNYFAFCGRVIAFALMHKVQVGIAFDRVFFLQLAGEEISLEDVRYADPCMYKSCKKILEMDADFIDSDAMGLTFVWEIEEFGSRKVVELCPGGNSIAVNSKNREEYVELLIQHCFVKSISEKVSYFTRGFGDILCKRRHRKTFFQRFKLKDINSMLLGSNEAICVKDWKAHTYYDDYKENDEQICWFWEVVEGMSLEQQRDLLFFWTSVVEGMSLEQQRGLLFFWTSVKYLPVNGFSGLHSRLCIYKTSGSHHRLPSSHTCFYRLSLPNYPSLAVTQQHLFLICQEHVGCSFGFV